MRIKCWNIVTIILSNFLEPFEILFLNPYLILIEHRNLIRIYCTQDLSINYVIELEEGTILF